MGTEQDRQTDRVAEDRCVNCGAGSDVPGGLKVIGEGDYFVCRRDLDCIARDRTQLHPPELTSSAAGDRRAAIDADYAKRGR